VDITVDVELDDEVEVELPCNACMRVVMAL
jgi:hypothetical protein